VDGKFRQENSARSPKSDELFLLKTEIHETVLRENDKASQKFSASVADNCPAIWLLEFVT